MIAGIIRSSFLRQVPALSQIPVDFGRFGSRAAAGRSYRWGFRIGYIRNNPYWRWQDGLFPKTFSGKRTALYRMPAQENYFILPGGTRAEYFGAVVPASAVLVRGVHLNKAVPLATAADRNFKLKYCIASHYEIALSDGNRVRLYAIDPTDLKILQRTYPYIAVAKPDAEGPKTDPISKYSSILPPPNTVRK